MKTVREILSEYVATTGDFGGEEAAKDESAERERRATELSVQLGEEGETVTRLFYIWLVLLVLVFTFLLTAAALHLGEPYITLPIGGGALIWILTRVEAMWREVRLHNLVVRLARASSDNPKLHDEVILLLAEALRVDQRVRERGAVPLGSPPALEAAKENGLAAQAKIQAAPKAAKSRKGTKKQEE